MSKSTKKAIISTICTLFLLPVLWGGFILYRDIRDTSTRIERGAIDRIIASESPVYYDDGVTPIGMFFEKTHRIHMDYEEIPKIFIKALVAAEDGSFFSHKGLDIKSIIRALISNLRSGRIVQGGSTITQQAAKNIFKREKRSYAAKFRELIQAFLLERKYTKEEILEMYINQFFVTGYGNGLGIAAQCFFDKDAKDLDLVEAAFIAGSVKGPNRYNPFIAKTEPARTRALEMAETRKNYVLKNMFKLNFITKDQYLEAKNRPVPFKEGKVTYRLNVIMDYVREQLESGYFRNILEEQGVDNISSSGIKIFTSVNKDIQQAALKSLRTHLPLMDVKLNGYHMRNIPDTYAEFSKGNQSTSQGNLPFPARITHINADMDTCCMVVSWGQQGGIINYDGIAPMGRAWLNWKMGEAAVFDKKYLSLFLKNFHVGDVVPVRLISSPDNHNETRLELSAVPELEGSIIVLRNGMIKAMVGGYMDRFFNRAVDAKRQLGSIFKPIVYTAALQLKWNILDPLMNTRNLFPFENTVYVPNPDHEPRSDRVSMAWAGAKSENLATVWLLYHLTDHLNPVEFQEVVKQVGLGQKEGESYPEYKKRIRDQNGVVVDMNALREAAFDKTINDITSDIIFSGHDEMLYYVKRLHLDLDNVQLDNRQPENREILRFSLSRLSRFHQNMKVRYRSLLRELEAAKQNTAPDLMSENQKPINYFYRTGGAETPEKIIYTEDPTVPYTRSLVPLTLEWVQMRDLPIEPKEIWVDGLFTSDILDLMQEGLSQNLAAIRAHRRYDMDTLYWIKDFRTLVNLRYIVDFSQRIGITTPLEPVLSFPLGPNVISIGEAALAYQTIMTGCVFPVSADKDPSMVPIITKIVDRDGEILWEYKSKPVEILTSRTCALSTEILRKVMEIGTGKKANHAVRLSGVSIPSFGKTGTSNRFTNSSFVGFIPGPAKDTGQLDIQDGYVIAGYVGYDDNRPMKSKHMAIYGASGALPLWVETAKAIVNNENYQKNVQIADLVFDPVPDLLAGAGNFVSVPVSPVSGLPQNLFDESARGPFQVLTDLDLRKGDFELKRRFEPEGGQIQ